MFYTQFYLLRAGNIKIYLFQLHKVRKYVYKPFTEEE